MFYCKGKIKAIVMIVALVMLIAVAATFCIWEDTSLKSLNTKGATTNYTGVRPISASTALGTRLTIDGIGYTVGYNGGSFITVLSDNVSSKGVVRYFDNDNSAYDYGESDIFKSVENYYTTLANKVITMNGDAYAHVREYIVPHLGAHGNLWLPSGFEMGGYGSSTAQPVMNYYNSASRRAGVGGSYWLRSAAEIALPPRFEIINSSGEFGLDKAYNTQSIVRVALNLRIGL